MAGLLAGGLLKIGTLVAQKAGPKIVTKIGQTIAKKKAQKAAQQAATKKLSSSVVSSSLKKAGSTVAKKAAGALKSAAQKMASLYKGSLYGGITSVLSVAGMMLTGMDWKIMAAAAAFIFCFGISAMYFLDDSYFAFLPSPF